MPRLFYLSLPQPGFLDFEPQCPEEGSGEEPENQTVCLILEFLQRFQSDF